MSESVDSRLLAWLRTPAAYPHRPESVTLAETHISCVFLAGERVYKLKKPVVYPFLDFSTLAARERSCRDELRLNRQLAPDVYLGVVEIKGSRENNVVWRGVESHNFAPFLDGMLDAGLNLPREAVRARLDQFVAGEVLLHALTIPEGWTARGREEDKVAALDASNKLRV